jgi:hypothetical protein
VKAIEKGSQNRWDSCADTGSIPLASPTGRQRMIRATRRERNFQFERQVLM